MGPNRLPPMPEDKVQHWTASKNTFSIEVPLLHAKILCDASQDPMRVCAHVQPDGAPSQHTSMFQLIWHPPPTVL
jgi:hypothetical protein